MMFNELKEKINVSLKGLEELKYRYIKRTGSPGHYQYFYREGQKPTTNKTNSTKGKEITKNDYQKKIGAFVIKTDLPIFDTALDDFDNPHKHYNFKLDWMEPKKVLLEQYKLSGDYKEGGMSNFDKWINFGKENPRKDWLHNKMKKGDGEVPMIVFEYNKDGTSTSFQEGRTRALVAMELGLTKIPILRAKKRF